MKKIVLPALLLLGATSGFTQELGRVISSTPVLQQVAVPRQVCTTQQVTTEGQKSGAGAVMGAIAGGAMGNAIGDGNGRVAATMLGLVGGAILGDKIEGGGQAQTHNVQNCTTQTFYENRTVGYHVVYEYAGKQYSVQMPHDPGQYVKLQITPISSAAPDVQALPAVATQPAYAVPVYGAVAPVYYNRPYYPPVSLNLDYAYVRGRSHHWH